MSHAFVKDDDARWLHEIPPTMRALLVFLTNEYGRPAFEKSSYMDEKREVAYHVMNDGLTYFVNEKGHWETKE
jgi:hypothetical protein